MSTGRHFVIVTVGVGVLAEQPGRAGDPAEVIPVDTVATKRIEIDAGAPVPMQAIKAALGDPRIVDLAHARANGSEEAENG